MPSGVRAVMAAQCLDGQGRGGNGDSVGGCIRHRTGGGRVGGAGGTSDQTSGGTSQQDRAGAEQGEGQAPCSSRPRSRFFRRAGGVLGRARGAAGCSDTRRAWAVGGGGGAV